MTRRPGSPPRFSVKCPAPKALAVQKIEDRGRFRSSPRTRGLGAKWDKLSVAFRRQNPFCRFCEQQGRDTYADEVDHILPRSDFSEKTYDWKNLQSLCRHHHNVKQAMEVFAREKGLLLELPTWCSSLADRPSRFKAY